MTRVPVLRPDSELIIAYELNFSMLIFVFRAIFGVQSNILINYSRDALPDFHFRLSEKSQSVA